METQLELCFERKKRGLTVECKKLLNAEDIKNDKPMDETLTCISRATVDTIALSSVASFDLWRPAGVAG